MTSGRGAGRGRPSAGPIAEKRFIDVNGSSQGMCMVASCERRGSGMSFTGRELGVTTLLADVDVAPCMPSESGTGSQLPERLCPAAGPA